MKRCIAILLMIIFLAGCRSGDALMEQALQLRGKLQGSGVEFDAEVVADYGDKTYTFGMHCQSDAIGNLKFAVTQPETIQGISGTVAQGTGQLTFDDKILAFDILADGLISPVSGPWVMMQTLRGGYLTACGRDDLGIRLSIDDSYAEKPLHLEIWLDETNLPKYCEIFWNGRRLLSIKISSFTFV